MKNKRILYILIFLLTIFFLRCVIWLNFSLKKELTFLLDEELNKKIIEAVNEGKQIDNYFFLILIYLYLFIFLIGIINLFFFLIKKIQKKPLIDLKEKIKEFPLTQEKTINLFFIIILIIFIGYFIEFILFLTKLKTNLLEFIIFLNLYLQIGIIIVGIKNLGVYYLGFNLKKKHLLSLAKIYPATLPLLLGASLLNVTILNKLNFPLSANPVTVFLFLLKDKILIILFILQVIFFAPISEEIFFRGILYKLMRKKFSFRVSSVLVSVAFALLHKTPQIILPLFIISIFLCYLYEKTQSIITPITFHFLFNFSNLLLFISLL
jgi:hypothetical protein